MTPFFIRLLFVSALSFFIQLVRGQDNRTIPDTSFLTDQLLSETPVTISASSYYCFSTSHFRVEIVNDCNGYVARWHQSHGPISLSKPDEGVTPLSTAQLTALRAFEQTFTQPPTHKGRCRGTDVIHFSAPLREKIQRYCGCNDSPYTALSKIIFNNPPANTPAPKQSTSTNSL